MWFSASNFAPSEILFHVFIVDLTKLKFVEENMALSFTVFLLLLPENQATRDSFVV